MCDKCLELDYPVADIWRPCAIPRPRRSPIPSTPRGGFSDEDYDAQLKINTLMATIRRQREEISHLKAIQQKADSRDSFEGVE